MPAPAGGRVLAEVCSDFGARSRPPADPDDREFYDRIRADPDARRFLGLDA